MPRDRVRRDEPKGSPQPWKRAAPDSPGIAQILGLQRSAGNVAVQRALLQRAPEDDQRYAMTVASGDWAGVAKLLLALDVAPMVRRLKSLRIDQLRYLDGAVRRMGVKNSKLRIYVHAGLMQLGANDDTAAPGAGYGAIEGKNPSIRDGKLRPDGDNRSARYRFEATFLPNPGAVDADEIAFVQTSHTVSTTARDADDADGSPHPTWMGANGSDRRTATDTKVDRVDGRTQGWIGMNDDGSAKEGRLRPWTRGSREAAWMTDTPSTSHANVDYTFETAAMAVKGPDTGKVYATVEWGFTVDAQMKVTPKDMRYFNKESPEFDLAVAFWNAQAGSWELEDGKKPNDTKVELPTPR